VIELWRSVAEDVLAPLLVEPYITGKSKYFEKARFEKGLSQHHFPPGRWRSLYAGIVRLRHQNKIVNWNNLIGNVSSTVNEDWFTEVFTLADPIRNVDFDSNVDKLIEIGNRMTAVDALQQAAENLIKGEEMGFVVRNVINDITTVSERRIEDETAEDNSKLIDSIFNNDPIQGIFTGIDFVDDSVGGLITGRMLMLAGAYKSSKTRIMINLAIRALREGKHPAILSFENPKVVTSMQIISMLAVEYLIKKIPYDASQSVFHIAPDTLIRLGNTYKQKMGGIKAEAIEYARETFRGFGDRIRIYDQSHKGGNLSDIPSVQSVITRDMHLYGGNVFFIDHQGLIAGNSGKIYEDTRYVSGELMRISRYSDPHPISLVVLAQLNEEEIKRKKQGYGSGIKGGGDTNANADYVLRLTPVLESSLGGEAKFYDDRTQLQVKLNRWGKTTGRKQVNFEPNSGLIVGLQPIEKTEPEVEATEETPF